jgi:hypothetical protein
MFVVVYQYFLKCSLKEKRKTLTQPTRITERPCPVRTPPPLGRLPNIARMALPRRRRPLAGPIMGMHVSASSTPSLAQRLSFDNCTMYSDGERESRCASKKRNRSTHTALPVLALWLALHPAHRRARRARALHADELHVLLRRRLRRPCPRLRLCPRC